MSSLLSQSASVLEMDHPAEHSDAPSKSFTRDPFPSSPSSSSSSTNNQHDAHRQHPQNSSPSPPNPGSLSPPSSSNATASVNGHTLDPKEEIRQVPSQSSPPHGSDEHADKGLEEHVSRPKDEADRDEAGLLPGSDPDDDPDMGSGESDGDWSQDDIDADTRRVKVYELIGQKWTDRGTAFCQGEYDEELQEARLIARAEHSNEILLQCLIRVNDVYQRQQDTLIVWTEPDGTDYALSFQDMEGCGEVWEFIAEVQRHLAEKGVSCLRSIIAGLAQLIVMPVPRTSTEEEARRTQAGSSMHMFSAGNLLAVGPKLPMPSMGNLHECERIIKQINRQPHGKEKLCDLLIRNDYIKKIVDVMKQAEDLEDLKELHACCSCMQTILLVNDHALYEHVLQDSLCKDVFGVLEYDPEFPNHKASYREFLESSVIFKEPIPIRDSQTRAKIHQTYRLQFLKDFVLARATDDATFNVLNSCIIFNQIDIVNNIQQDDRFVREIVGLFLITEKGDAGKEKDKDMSKRTDKGKTKEEKEALEPTQKGGQTIVGDASSKENASNNGVRASSPEIGPSPAPNITASPLSTTDERRKDTIILIQQLCIMGKNVQLPIRLALFRMLVDRGILHAIQWALGRPEPLMVSTAGEVLGLLLDHDVNGVRQHVMKQVGVAGKPSMGLSVGVAGQGNDVAGMEGKRETLLETLCRSLAISSEMAYKSQTADALRALLEVPQTDGPEATNNATNTNTNNNNLATLRAMARAKDDPVVERFLDYFYQKCIENLFRPMAELPEHHKITEPILRLSRERSTLYLYLCDLLTSFTLQHSFRSHFFIISSSNVTPPLIPRIASLLRAREKHLRLAALRFFRACLRLGNRNMVLQLIKHDAILPILNLTAREAKWDNLLSSCCQEFFEHIRRENIKELLQHLMTKYEDKVRELARSAVCGERFQNLIRRWEMNNEPPPKEIEKSQPIAPSLRKWGQGRLLEIEEEDYFNNSDEEDTPKANNPWPSVSSLGSVNTLKRKRARGFSGSSSGPPPKQSRPSLPQATQSLVDYDEDDEPEPVVDSVASSSKPTESIPEKVDAESALSPVKQIDWFAESFKPSTDSLPVKKALAQNPFDDDEPITERPTRPTRLGSPLRSSSPPRLGEKRRREDEDDEDEMLERLVRSKRQSIGPSPEKEDSKPTSSKPAALPGKMRLKIGASSFAMASSSPSGESPEKDMKDVDSG